MKPKESCWITNLFNLMPWGLHRIKHGFFFFSNSQQKNQNSKWFINQGFSSSFKETGWRIGVSVSPFSSTPVSKLSWLRRLLEVSDSSSQPFSLFIFQAKVQQTRKKIIKTKYRQKDILGRLEGSTCKLTCAIHWGWIPLSYWTAPCSCHRLLCSCTFS
jgi:hypothetical protein